MKTTPTKDTPKDLMDRLAEKLVSLKREIDSEANFRFQIKQSKSWLAYEEDIKTTDEAIRELQDERKQIAANQAELLTTIPDSMPEYEATKAQLLRIMEQEGLNGIAENYGSIVAKWSEKKAVNKSQLFNLLGDLDTFLRVVEVPQSKLKDFAQETPQLRGQLLKCIQVTSRSISDLDVQLPTA